MADITEIKNPDTSSERQEIDTQGYKRRSSEERDSAQMRSNRRDSESRDADTRPRKKKKRRKKIFWKLYWAFIVLVVIGLFWLYRYTRGIMIEYEESTPQNYITSMIKEGSSGEIGKYLSSAFDSTYAGGSTRQERFNSALSGELEFKSVRYSDTEVTAYEITSDGKPFLSIGIRETGTDIKLSIIPISKWEIEYCVLRDPDSSQTKLSLGENKGYTVTVNIPESFTLLMDGEAADLSGASETAIEDFAKVAAYADVPAQFTLEYKDLCFEPALTALNNGGESVSGTLAQNVYTVAANYVSTAEAETIGKAAADPIKAAETWSKFMTDDIGGSNHGLATVLSTCKILEGSNLYDQATSWAKSADIGYVAVHDLNSITNKSATNYILYNDHFFSVDVHLEKNMTLYYGTNRSPVDVFNNRMCYVYIDDGSVTTGWYLVDMFTI